MTEATAREGDERKELHSTAATRRAPHMEKYVRLRTRVDGTDEAIMYLQVGSQSFRLDGTHDSLGHAEWTRDMLCIALDKIVKAETSALAASPPPSAGGEVERAQMYIDGFDGKNELSVGPHMLREALGEVLRSHASLQSEVETFRRREGELQQFFCTEFPAMASEGDIANWTPEHAAIVLIRRLKSQLAKARADVIEEAAKVLSNKANSAQAEHNDALDDERYEPLDREITEGRIDGLKWAARIVHSLAHGGGA